MKIAMWILKAFLLVWDLIGGYYTINNYQNVGSVWALNSLPGFVWILLGVVQILLAIGLVVPSKIVKVHNSVQISAYGLCVISLLGVVLFITYAGFPGLLWAVIPAVLAGFVAYKSKA